MIRKILLIVCASLLWAGWAWAREQELINHPHDAEIQVMEDPGCDPTSNSSGAG